MPRAQALIELLRWPWRRYSAAVRLAVVPLTPLLTYLALPCSLLLMLVLLLLVLVLLHLVLVILV
jgi:hypothetical protein